MLSLIPSLLLKHAFANSPFGYHGFSGYSSTGRCIPDIVDNLLSDADAHGDLTTFEFLSGGNENSNSSSMITPSKFSGLSNKDSVGKDHCIFHHNYSVVTYIFIFDIMPASI